MKKKPFVLKSFWGIWTLYKARGSMHFVVGRGFTPASAIAAAKRNNFRISDDQPAIALERLRSI